MLLELMTLGGIACSDGNDRFERALDPIDAAAAVRIKLSKRGNGLSARATMHLGDITVERSFQTDSLQCKPLAEAIAFWTRMALDDNEAIRAYGRTSPEDRPASEGPRETGYAKSDRQTSTRQAPVRETRPLRDEEGGFEQFTDSASSSKVIQNFDVGGFVLAGVGKHTVLGGAISPTFTLFDALLRTSFLFGKDTSGEQVSLFGVAAAVCKRFPGNYARAQGISFDVCGEATGTLHREGDLQVAIGPSAALRGEISEHFAMELRVSGGVNITRTVAQIDPPSRFSSRGELNFSWKP